MLGVAAEQVFGRLAAAFVAARPVDTGRLPALLSDNTSHYRRFDEFRKRLEPIRGTLPEGLADAITLDAVADLLRVTRNAAGHPTGRLVDEETAYAHLVMAAMLLAKMTELGGPLRASGIADVERRQSGTDAHDGRYARLCISRAAAATAIPPCRKGSAYGTRRRSLLGRHQLDRSASVLQANVSDTARVAALTATRH